MMGSNIREVQLVELDILKKIKSICEKYDLTYYLAYGTLLGAIRHRGFIPWDDDIDIVMPAPDYLKFCRIVKKELGRDYFFQTAYTDPGYHYCYGKVMKNGTTALTLKEKYLDIHWSIYVDVFPLVSYRDQEEYLKKQRILSKYMAIVNTEYRRYNRENNTFKTKLFDLSPVWLRKELGKHYYNQLTKDYNPGYPMKILSAGRFGSNEYLPKDFSGPKRYMQFEDDTFRVPSDTEGLLTRIFGDYMKLPPIEKRLGHAERFKTEIILDCNHSYEMYK